MKFVAITSSTPISFKIYSYTEICYLFFYSVFFKHVYVNVVLFLLVCLEFNAYIQCAFIVKYWGQTGSSNT